MSYQFLNLVKRSFADFLKEQIQVNSPYVIGDGSTNIKFYDSFPVDPIGFSLPAVSLDYDIVADRIEYDLGVDARHPYSFMVDVFAESNFDREYIGGTIKDFVERNSVAIYDYNYEPACNIGYLRPTIVVGTTLRTESPGGEEEYRFRLSVTLEALRNYK